MIYAGSKAQSGAGSGLNIIGPVGGTGTPTPTPVGEIKDLPFTEPMLKMASSTNLQSTIEEQIPVIPDVTSWDLTCNRVANDPGQMMLHAAYVARIPYMFSVALGPNVKAGQVTTGDSWTFNAYVKQPKLSGIKADDLIQVSYNIEYTTLPLFTAGS